jgi:hypothetical protein
VPQPKEDWQQQQQQQQLYLSPVQRLQPKLPDLSGRANHQRSNVCIPATPSLLVAAPSPLVTAPQQQHLRAESGEGGGEEQGEGAALKPKVFQGPIGQLQGRLYRRNKRCATSWPTERSDGGQGAEGTCPGVAKGLGACKMCAFGGGILCEDCEH